MGSRALVSIAAILTAGAVLAQDAPSRAGQPLIAPRPSPPPVVYLSGMGAMEKLKSANPDHYARAERILAAAEELCKPGPEQVYYARFEAKSISCDGMVLKTSNPPKREIGFTLDDTRYVALVTVQGTEPSFRHVPNEEPEMRVRPNDLRQLVPPLQPVEAGK